MTLRIELSIIPFGDENRKKVIETINVSNMGRVTMEEHFYCVEHNTFKEDLTPRIQHVREEGALVLAEKALHYLNTGGVL